MVNNRKTAQKIIICAASILIFNNSAVHSKTDVNNYLKTATEKYNKQDLSGASKDIAKAAKSGKSETDLAKIKKNVAEAYFKRAGDKYNKDDLYGAIDDFESGLKLQNSESAKNIMGLCLSEIIQKLYVGQKDYQKSIVYLEKLIKLYPEDKDYKEMYDIAKKHVIKGVEALPGVESRQETKRIERLFELMESRLQRQEEVLKSYNDRLAMEIRKDAKDAKIDKEKFLKDIENTVNVKKKNIVYTVGLVTFATMCVAFFIFFLAAWFFRKKSSKYMEIYNRREVNGRIISDVSVSLPYKQEEEPNQRMIDELEIIKRDLNGVSDSKAIEDALQPYLDCNNEFVKIAAAEILFTHDKIKALGILSVFLNSPNASVRSSAVKTLGELSSPEAIEILYDFVKNTEDAGLKKEIIKCFIEILKNTEQVFPNNLTEKIRKYIFEIKSKEMWIVE
ncbi:MAG: HEAT repeat domain-containing protein [Elusimicrobia bacterium]|nr:HEAT repeat domain-containing protein [Elusimicrobiota bacterium]